MFVRLSAGLLAAFLASQGTPRPVSLIVNNGIVVTMDSARRVLAPGAAAIEGERSRRSAHPRRLPGPTVRLNRSMPAATS
jgi:hypothetical protein